MNRSEKITLLAKVYRLGGIIAILGMVKHYIHILGESNSLVRTFGYAIAYYLTQLGMRVHKLTTSTFTIFIFYINYFEEISLCKTRIRQTKRFTKRATPYLLG
jgi:hypothetical protein